jgi:hypothetical protein
VKLPNVMTTLVGADAACATEELKEKKRKKPNSQKTTAVITWSLSSSSSWSGFRKMSNFTGSPFFLSDCFAPELSDKNFLFGDRLCFPNHFGHS